jgi:hypothetical protein
VKIAATYQMSLYMPLLQGIVGPITMTAATSAAVLQ